MKKVHRFFGAFPLGEREIEIRDGDTVHQMARVLKLRDGEEVVLCAGDGREAHGVIEAIEKTFVHVRMNEVQINTREPKARVTLYQAMLKRDGMEWVVQKATEVGVARIVPVISDRVIKMGMNIDRWQTIAREAAEQCERGIVPEIADPMTFDEALKDSVSCNARWFTHTEEGLPRIKSANETAVAVFAGPEGGWTNEEADHALAAGCMPCSLGSTILRGETAGILAVYSALGRGWHTRKNFVQRTLTIHHREYSEVFF